MVHPPARCSFRASGPSEQNCALDPYQ
jgi:hypothetical protein